MTSTSPKQNSHRNPSKESAWACFTAPSLILIAPFIVFTSYQGLPFSSPEVMLIIFGMILIGLVFGLIMGNLGHLGQTIFFACLLGFSLGMIGDYKAKGTTICMLVAFLFSWFFREKATKIITFTVSVFIAVTQIFPSDQLTPTTKEFSRISGKSDLPPVIHLILDGYIGVEGIPGFLDRDKKLKKDITSFFTQNEFYIFGNIYSHYFSTRKSIPSLLNFDPRKEANKRYRKRTSDGQNFAVAKNKYFQEMGALGYRIKIYQSTYLDYCQSNLHIASCYTYQPSSLNFLPNLASSVSSKVWVVLNSYLLHSIIIQTIKQKYLHFHIYIQKRFGFKLPYPWKWNSKNAGPIASSQTLEKLSADIQYSSAGTLFFAHLLTPHGPFVYDSNCQIYKNPISEWLGSEDLTAFKKRKSISSRAKRYKRYMQQINCLNKQLQGLFGALRSSKIYDNAIIIIHGDHGSRIWMSKPKDANLNIINSADKLDAFSTLFAVKANGYNALYDPQVLSLYQVFSKIAGSMFNSEKNIDTEFPYVNSPTQYQFEK